MQHIHVIRICVMIKYSIGKHVPSHVILDTDCLFSQHKFIFLIEFEKNIGINVKGGGSMENKFEEIFS